MVGASRARAIIRCGRSIAAISLLGALINVNTREDTVAAKARGARTIEGAIQIRTVGVGVAVVGRCRGHSLGECALIDIGAEEAVAPDARRGTRARVRPRRVRACRARVASMRAQGALIHVIARDTVAREARGATALKRTRKVRASGRVVAVVGAGRALIDLRARVQRRRVAAHARARATNEVGGRRRCNWTARAVIRARTVARGAACIAQATRGR